MSFDLTPVLVAGIAAGASIGTGALSIRNRRSQRTAEGDQNDQLDIISAQTNGALDRLGARNAALVEMVTELREQLVTLDRRHAAHNDALMDTITNLRAELAELRRLALGFPKGVQL